jgi:hypothetical protein
MPEKHEEVTVTKLANDLYQVSFFLNKKDMVEVQQGLGSSMVKMFLKGRVGEVASKLAAALKAALK